MNIVIFTENYHRGGVDTFISTLLNHWPDPGTEFTLVCNQDHPGLEDIRSRLRRPCTVVTHGIATYSGLAIKTRGKRFFDLLRKAATPVIKYLYLAYAVCKLRAVLCSGQYDRLLVVNGGYPGGDTCRAAGIAWGLFSGRPSSVHNFHNISITPRKLLRIQENLVDRILSRYTKSFITVSRAAASSMGLRTSIPACKVSHIYNGLEVADTVKETVDIRNEVGIPTDAPLCLMLGTYESRKGHSFLLKSFRLAADACPGAHLLICGYGSANEISDVQQSVEELKLLHNVHLMGFRNDAMDILRQADILVVASQEFESFGLTCVEAMARRIPVLATDVGGLPEVVENNVGGYCVPKDDVQQYASKLLQLLLNPEECKKQGNLGYDRFEHFFKAERMSLEYASLFNDSTDFQSKGA